MNIGETFTPIRPLFQKLTLRPEAISNPLRIAFRDQRLLTDASPIHKELTPGRVYIELFILVVYLIKNA
jgi:hypothetical protein